MSRRASDLRSTSPSHSPVHSTVPKFHDSGFRSSSDDDAVDTNLEEELLTEIRTLVKKEKYLAQLQDQLDEFQGDSGLTDINRVQREELDNEVRFHGKTRSERTQPKSKVNLLSARAISHNLSIAREHYRACFVEVNPIQLRDIRRLVLVSQDLHIHQLRTLSKNLFLFNALRSVNLSNNQLDDSGSKEIRTTVEVKQNSVGLQVLDLSRNLLGKLSARTICERLRHQAKLLSLDLHGNLFFADEGETAGEVARLFAKAVAVNEHIQHFYLSVQDQYDKYMTLGEQWSNASRAPSHAKKKHVKGKSSEFTSAAVEFSQLLAEELRQGGRHNKLQSLGLCYAEFSRKVVLNTMKMANRLTILDLSFAFVGIPGAQVVAAALRIDGYASLTQLNMRCNRTKSMGARVILAALDMNERLTSLDLSHNEIRSDIVDTVVDMLNQNKVLTRLDLSQNDLCGDRTEEELRCLRDVIVGHRALLSLGQLNSVGANVAQERMLHGALVKNRISDDYVLGSVNAVTTSRTNDEAAPPKKRHILSTIVELDDAAAFTRVWKREITKDGRHSLKWRMAVKATHKASASSSLMHSSPLAWKLVVHRKCDARGVLEDEAATAHFHDEEGSSSYALYSAVVYCEKGDSLSLQLGINHGEDLKQPYKVFVKDIVFISHHPQDRQHLLLSIPQSFTGSPIPWRMKPQRRMMLAAQDGVNPSSFLWEGVVQRVYIHTTGVFRLLARVQLPERLAPTADEKINELNSRFWWQLQRSSCWDPHTNQTVVEGTCFAMHGALRNGRDLVFYLPAMEWMAGEYLQLSVTTPNDDVVLRVVQFQVLHEVANWECPSTISCLNFAA